MKKAVTYRQVNHHLCNLTFILSSIILLVVFFKSNHPHHFSPYVLISSICKYWLYYRIYHIIFDFLWVP